MNLFTSSGDALLCLLNSSFTYWSPRAFSSIGRNRCRTRILLYRERTLDMWAEAAMLEPDVNSIFTENSNNNKTALKKGHSTKYYSTSLFVPEMVFFFWFGNYVRGAYAAPGGRAGYRKVAKIISTT